MLWICGLIATAVFAFPPDHYKDQLWIGLTFLGLGLSLRLWNLNRWAGLFMAYVFAHSLALLYSNEFMRYGWDVAALLQSHMSNRLLLVVIIGAAFQGLKPRHVNACKIGFQAVAIINSAMLMTGSGILNNPAASACFQVCLLPLMYFPNALRGGRIMGCALIGIPFAGSVTAWAALVVLIFAYTARHWRLILWLIPLMGILFIMFGLITEQGNVFDSAGRVDLWATIFRHWYEQRYFVGTGFGSYPLFGPHIQTLHGHGDGTLWIWLHNDWLQILFELGVPGFILALGFWISALIKTRRQPALFASWLTLGFCMTTQYHLQLLLPCVYLAYLTVKTFRENKSK